MITLVIRRYFSKKSNVAMQNFFEINPIYPSNGQKDTIIFKQKRPTIKPLEHNFHLLRRRFAANDYIDSRIQAALREPSQKDKDATKKIILQAQTKLPVGLGFNWYIEKLKGRSSKNFSLRYVEIISDLIRKFQLRNEPELVRFFRLAIADSKSNDIIKQLKGSILQNVIKQSVKRKGEKQNSQLHQNLQQHTETIEVEGNTKQLQKQSKDQMNIKLKKKKALEEDRRRQFYAALKQIDANIAQSEINLKIHQRHSLRHDLYDTNFQTPDEWKMQEDPEADIANDNIRTIISGISKPLTGGQKTHDYFIEQRIKRLYFLKKLEQAQKGDKNQLLSVKQQATPYSINVGHHEYQIAELAAKYNLLDIVPETEIDDIYNVIDLFLSQLNLNVKDNMSLEQLKEEMSRSTIDPADYLWESMRVDKILEGECHNKSEFIIKEEEKFNTDSNVQLESSVNPTPNFVVETTLNNTPFNVYQHNDMGIFGGISQNRSLKGVKDILGDYQIDPTDTYRRFQFQIPKERIVPPPRKWSPPVGDVYDYGKRKSGTALCRIRPGTGIVNINKNSIRHYFPEPYYRAEALKPALLTGICGKIDVDFYIQGSGIHSQAQACCNALSRALYKAYPRFKKLLRRAGLVTIDPRFKERKHSGRYKARKSYVYVRR